MLISLLLWQGAWLTAVLGAGAGAPRLASAGVIVLVAIALGIRGALRKELVLIGAAVGIGFAVDSAIVLLGWLDFPPDARFGAPSTVWMALLWANLAVHTAPGTIFGWLEGRLALQVFIGATSGPPAYYGGAKLGAVTFGADPVPGLIALAVIWAVGFPLLYRLRTWLVPPTENETTESDTPAIETSSEGEAVTA